MSDTPQGPGWWLASDGKYYAPEQRQTPPPPPPPPPDVTSTPPAWEPPPAPSTTGGPPKGRRRLPVALLAIGAVAAVAATVFGGWMLFGPDQKDATVPGPEAVGVRFTLLAVDDVSGTLGDCYGTGGYDDFGPGMDIRVTNEDGKLIGSGTTLSFNSVETSAPEYYEILTADSDMNFNDDAFILCEVAALVQLSSTAEFYRVEVGRRGETSHTHAELEEADWQVELSLGT